MLTKQVTALRDVADATMLILNREIGETVNLAILEGREVLILHVMESPHEFRLAAKVGNRQPFYLTALGKAMVAFLPHEKAESLLVNLRVPLLTPTPNSIRDLIRLKEELILVRERGYAIDNEELFVGARAVAAPIIGGKGEVEASLSISAPASRMPPERVTEIAGSLLEATSHITARLGGDPEIFKLLSGQSQL